MRLFGAISFPEEVLEGLEETVETLKSQGRGRFARREELHLTLAFLGETEREAEARAVLEAVCRETAPFPLVLEGMGRFGDLLWAGVQENPALADLARRMQERYRQAGFFLPERDWRPHVTLVRHWRGPDALPERPALKMEVREIHLLSSRPERRPRYLLWERGELSGETTPGRCNFPGDSV